MPYLHSTHAARPLFHSAAGHSGQTSKVENLFLLYASSLSLSMARTEPGQTRLFHVIERLDSALTRSHTATAMNCFLFNG